MAISRETLNSIKSRFETGDKPTGADYVALIETLAAQSTELGSFGTNDVTPDLDIDQTVFGIENTTTIDSFDSSEWRMVKYAVSISCTSGGVNKAYSTELTILLDNNDINVSQYGMIDNDGDVGTVDVSKSGGLVYLKVIPASPLMPVTARFYRTGLKA